MQGNQSPATLLAIPETINEPTWYLNSCATHYITSSLANLDVKSKYTSFEKLHIGNGSGLYIQHIGSSSFSCENDPRKRFEFRQFIICSSNN